jgi:hypothetical protein
MLEFATVKEWKEVFGKDYEDSVFELVDTHHVFDIKEDKVYFHLNLFELFDDAIDMFEVDPDLVDESVQLAMVFSDPELNPDVLTNLIDFVEEKLGYSPVDNSGGFSLTITDVRKFYGEEQFDKEMSDLFQGHTAWWNTTE